MQMTRRPKSLSTSGPLSMRRSRPSRRELSLTVVLPEAGICVCRIARRPFTDYNDFQLPDPATSVTTVEYSEGFGKTIVTGLAAPRVDVVDFTKDVSWPEGRPGLPNGGPSTTVDRDPPMVSGETAGPRHVRRGIPRHSPLVQDTT